MTNDFVITVDTCIAVCVMLRDYHINKSCVEFSHSRYRIYLAMKNFALKLSRKVKACSKAENKPADIFLKLKLMSSETKTKFLNDGSDTEFSCQILSKTCLHNKISLIEELQKQKSDVYLKTSFFWVCR